MLSAEMSFQIVFVYADVRFVADQALRLVLGGIFHEILQPVVFLSFGGC